MDINSSIESDLEQLDALRLLIENCKLTLEELREKINDSNSHRIERIFNTRHSLGQFRKDFCSKYEDILKKCSHVSPVTWLPSVDDYVAVKYISGKTPWSFYLNLSDNRPRSSITKMLKRQKSEGRLKRVKSPRAGMVLCCCTLFGPPFRGVILSVAAPSLDVLDIDSGKRFQVQITDCYELNQEAAKMNAQAIHCALFSENHNLEEKWTDAFSQTFEQNLHLPTDLQAMVLHEATLESTIPPKYLVKIKDNSTSSDFNEFLTWLNQIMESGLDLHMSPDQNRDYHVNDCDSETTSLTLLPSSYTQQLAIINDLSQEEELMSPPRWSNPYENDPSAFPLPTVNGGDNGSDGGEVSPTPTLMDATAAEFVPRDDKFGLEPDPQYVPQDDQNICQFFLKRDFCYKKGCTKKHVTKEEFERYKVECTSSKPKNLLNLPVIGQRVEMTVTHVISSHRFYAQLPSIYSDIGETGALETLETLMNDINDPESRNTLQALPDGIYPIIGEMLLAFGRYKQWARALVKNCDDFTVEVAYVDYGTSETLQHQFLRSMKPEFTHLPHQAVEVCLSGIYSLDDSDKALSFLKKKILGQKVEAVIRDHSDSKIEADVYLKNGTNLNKLQITEGYCTEWYKR